LWQTEERRSPITVKLQNILAEFRLGLEAIYGPRLAEVVLFGSQARNEASAESNIDVMIVLRGGVRPVHSADRTTEPFTRH
jgi:predicted nucleotidyltransferase